MPRPKKNKTSAPPDTPSAQLLAEKPLTPLSTKAKLLDDSDEDEEFHSAIQSPNEEGLKVNQEYARRFEHNKKREELHRLQEKYGDVSISKKRARDDDDDSDEDSSSSEDEDETAVLATETLDAEISATLAAIRKKDPRVYDGKTTFFSSIDEEGIASSEKQKKEKPIYLRDYHRENLLAGHTGAEDEDADEPKTFVQQQNDLKRTVVKEMHEAAEADDEEDDNDGFLVRKSTPKEDTVIDQPDPSTADPNNPDEYLEKFLASRTWAKADKDACVPLESDDSESDAEAEAFEYNFNMRFEDPDAAQRAKLVSYSRDATNDRSVRREEKNRRKKAREEKRLRKEQEKSQREAEKNRLRKLKTEELMEKFKKVKEAAGLDEVDAEAEADVFNKLLEGDFGDGEWEAWMQGRFGDQYYGAKDPMEKPVFDDDIDINDIIPDFSDDIPGDDENEAEGDDEQEDQGDDAMEVDGEEEDEEVHAPTKRKTKKDIIREKQERKQKDKQLRRKLERFVEDNFDVDDKIAGSKTSSFHYRQTTPETYGLTPIDILAAGDAELNQYAGLKKYAPFRDPERKQKDKKKYGKKKRLKQWRKEVFGDAKGVQMPENWKPEGLVTKAGEELRVEEASNIREREDGEGKKKKKKRRRKNKEES